MSFRRAFKGPFDPKMTPKGSFLAPRAILHQCNTWLTLPTLNAMETMGIEEYTTEVITMRTKVTAVGDWCIFGNSMYLTLIF